MNSSESGTINSVDVMSLADKTHFSHVGSIMKYPS